MVTWFPFGFRAPFRIPHSSGKKMEKPRVDEASARAMLMGDDIGELRKYIVEMMHAEMELMESIKLNERNVARVSARIKHFKELITQERTRYKALKSALAEDANELQILEEKQIVAEASHRQFQDAVTQRESEVQVLRARFQQQRAAMLSLRHQITESTAQLKNLSLSIQTVEMETHNISTALDECTEPAEQRAARQKFRSKIRYTQQFIAQMMEETSQLVEKRTKLEAEVLQCEQEAHKLRESVFCKEKEAEVLFNRLREDTFRVIRENGKIEGKLKAKRRKFRLKTKNEISSLKRRISFITSELERGQMTNEDALSIVDALSAKREALEDRLSGRNEQLAAVESAIAKLSSSVSAIGRGEGSFDTTRLQEELGKKRDDARSAQNKLQEKQNLLKVLEEDHTQLNTAFEDLSAQIVAAKNTTEGLDSEITSLAKDIELQEEKVRSLNAAVGDAQKKIAVLKSEYQEYQRKSKSTIKMQTKLRRERDSLQEQEKEMALQLRQVENLSRLLGEGIKHGTEYASRFNESVGLSEDKQKRIEFELRLQELSLQQQCAQEEAKFQAEVAIWDDKIKRVERQLRSL
ncbi:hypothetical protein PF004_g9257 [Phytophthora fragariae]|uniref:Uncharacterized protein n=2 Tax=Phytophthora fragariae TaxID=53985 RepID=A0A6A3L800_9STRA|nr:hypothetical protein PF011_g9047 [Phytophthora fragariae]KAE9234899.1 hypothetical protein PF004_g9257 [Phytophthora fragariae]